MSEQETNRHSLWGRVKASLIAMDEGSSGYIFTVLNSLGGRIKELEDQVEKLELRVDESSRE